MASTTSATSRISLSSSSFGIKPRLSFEDEDCAHLLLGISQLVTKELALPTNQQQQSQQQQPVAWTDSKNWPEDSLTIMQDNSSKSNNQGKEPTDSIVEEEIKTTSSSSASASPSSSASASLWKNPIRTVSMDEDLASLPPPPVEFVDWRFDHDNINNSNKKKHSVTKSNSQNCEQTSLPPFLHRTLHRPAVITPIRTMSRPVVTLPSNLMLSPRPPLPSPCQSMTSAFWSPSLTTAAAAVPPESMSFTKNRLVPRTLGVTTSSSSFSTTPSSPVKLEIPQGFPKLPPLLSMKRDKRMLRCRIPSNNSNNCNKNICSSSRTIVNNHCLEESAGGNNIQQPQLAKEASLSPLGQTQQSSSSPPPTTTTTVTLMDKQGKDNKSDVVVVGRKRNNGKKFSWKNYPGKYFCFGF
jgi:hypothetical protein